jgi:hypothetical protein
VPLLGLLAGQHRVALRRVQRPLDHRPLFRPGHTREPDQANGDARIGGSARARVGFD